MSESYHEFMARMKRETDDINKNREELNKELAELDRQHEREIKRIENEYLIVQAENICNKHQW